MCNRQVRFKIKNRNKMRKCEIRHPATLHSCYQSSVLSHNLYGCAIFVNHGDGFDRKKNPSDLSF